MKTITKISALVAALLMLLCFVSCEQNASGAGSNTGNHNNNGNENNPLYPFEGTSWYGDTYSIDGTTYSVNCFVNLASDANIHKEAYDKLVEFKGKKINANGVTYGTVNILNDLYFFWPEGYNSSTRVIKIIPKGSEFNYCVTKTKEGYEVTILNLFNKLCSFTVKDASATSADVYDITRAYISYGTEPDNKTWQSNDLLPRTLTKQ